MRGGYFLAEESPERLMNQWGAESLEDVFLKLSVIQNMGKRRRSSIAQDVIETITVPTGAINVRFCCVSPNMQPASLYNSAVCSSIQIQAKYTSKRKM